MPIAALDPSSPPSVFDFLERHVSSRGRMHWDWKYRLGADRSSRAFYHTDADGNVGAFIGMLPTALHASGQRARAAWFVDWATRPGDGSVGSGVALLRRAEATTDILLTLQGSADTQKILPKLRWSVVERPAVWILRTSARALVTRGPLRTHGWLRAPLLAIGTLVARVRRVRRGSATPFTLEPVGRIPPSYDAIWETRRTEFAPVMDRTSAQLNFMCTEFPDGGYRMFLVRERGAVVGHLVVRVDRKDDLVRGRIIDALWPRERADAVEWIVREACAVLQECSVDYIECTASVADLERALATCGFRRQRSVPIWYHRLPDGVPAPATWYVTYLDCDRAYR